MKNIPTFKDFINESLYNHTGPKFVEDFLTNKVESFEDIYQFYGWTRDNFPTVYTRDFISWDAAKKLNDDAAKKYPEYRFSVAEGMRSGHMTVDVHVHKALNRKTIYDLYLGQATSMRDIDSIIKDFESKVKNLS